MMSLSVTNYSSINEVHAERWQRLTRSEDFTTTLGYLRLRESLSVAQVCLVIASQSAEQFAGAAYATMVDGTAISYARPAVQLVSRESFRLDGEGGEAAVGAVASRWLADRVPS